MRLVFHAERQHSPNFRQSIMRFHPFLLLRRLALLVIVVGLSGCGEYNEQAYRPPQPAAVEGTVEGTVDAAADAPVDEPQPARNATADSPDATERTPLAEVGVKRVPLTNVVGVYLNAKASINSRLLANNAYSVAQQFKAINDRYPNDYAELEIELQKEGKELPELQAGHRYVFDPSDGQVYVESD
ncbi:MAG: hypothetical protein O2931_08685 [Planctomycetota bacterium]|nr:hypothetical protein [Planctomycetota bacterium]